MNTAKDILTTVGAAKTVEDARKIWATVIGQKRLSHSQAVEQVVKYIETSAAHDKLPLSSWKIIDGLGISEISNAVRRNKTLLAQSEDVDSFGIPESTHLDEHGGMGMSLGTEMLPGRKDNYEVLQGIRKKSGETTKPKSEADEILHGLNTKRSTDMGESVDSFGIPLND